MKPLGISFPAMLNRQSLSGFFQRMGMTWGDVHGTGKSPHGPVPPDPESEGQFFEPLPVEKDDEAMPVRGTARQRQFARMQQSIFRRRIAAGFWLLHRRISRLHRTHPAWLIAGFYLTVAVALGLALAYPLSRLMRPGELQPLAPYVRTTEESIQRLTTLVAARDMEGARVLAAQLEKEAPDDVRLLVAQGILASAAGDPEGAQAAFERADQLAPGNPPIVLNLAENEFVRGQYAEAEEYYQRVLSADPKNIRVIFRLYLCARMQKKDVAALEYLNRSSFARSSLEWYYLRAADAYFEGKNAEGDEYLKKAHVLFGNNARPYDRTLLRLGLIPSLPR